jgi:hypothetical protein
MLREGVRHRGDPKTRMTGSAGLSSAVHGAINVPDGGEKNKSPRMDPNAERYYQPE